MAIVSRLFNIKHYFIILGKKKITKEMLQIPIKENIFLVNYEAEILKRKCKLDQLETINYV